jgi:hypothetical protein
LLLKFVVELSSAFGESVEERIEDGLCECVKILLEEDIAFFFILD